MSQTEYLISLNIRLDPQALRSEPYRSFYRSHGLSAEGTEVLLGHGLNYLRMVATPPRTFLRLVAEEKVKLGSREFEVMTGAGHSPEQVMLYSRDDNLILSGDQILAKISPNVSVEAMDPDGDPLGLYLHSLEKLKATLPEDVLVLPGHNLPFVGLRTRANELIAHHEARCMAIVEACKVEPQTVADLVPVIFGRPIEDPHQLVFAFGEALAHVNAMISRRTAARRQRGARAGARGGVRKRTQPVAEDVIARRAAPWRSTPCGAADSGSVARRKERANYDKDGAAAPLDRFASPAMTSAAELGRQPCCRSPPALTSPAGIAMNGPSPTPSVLHVKARRRRV